MAANILDRLKLKDEQKLIKKYLATKKLSYLVDLYKPYIHLVYGIALRYVADDHQAQIITIKIFKKLARDLPQQEIRIFQSWLYIVTKNYCENWMMSRNNQAELVESVEVEDEKQFDFTLYGKDDRSFEAEISNMENEILNTKKEQEKCMDLFFKEQKCFQEIADITGYRLSNIKRHIKNAKKNINIYH